MLKHIAVKQSGNTFRCTFWHPIAKQPRAYGLGADQVAAESHCCQAVEIFNSPVLMNDPESPRLMAYSLKAYQMAFDRAAPWADKVKDDGEIPGTLDDDEIGELAVRIARRFGQSGEVDTIAAMLGRFESSRYRSLFKKFKSFENELTVARSQAAEAKRELAEMRRERGVGIDATMQDVFDKWRVYYKEGHAEKTIQEAVRTVELFIKSLPAAGKTKLTAVQGNTLNDFIRAMRAVKKKNGDGATLALSAKSKKKYSAYLRLFFNWTAQEYNLFENPAARLSVIAGAEKDVNDIVAVRRLDDLKELLAALQDEPYWGALVGTLILAGPRYSELANMTVDDVFLDENYIRIHGKKTGRWRKMTIEKTTLRPLLEAYLKWRKVNPVEHVGTKWLFPTMVPDNDFKPRTLSKPGIWSDNGVFNDAWEKVAKKRFKPAASYRTYGPREFRHTFGTILAHTKWSALQIAEAMGNSELIVRRYYVAPGSGGHEWPFQF